MKKKFNKEGIVNVLKWWADVIWKGLVYGFAAVGVAWTIWYWSLSRKIGGDALDDELMDFADRIMDKYN